MKAYDNHSYLLVLVGIKQDVGISHDRMIVVMYKQED